MRKPVTMRNVIFPLWFLLVFPMTWIAVLPANFIIDSLVMFFAMKYLKLENKKILWKAAIFKVWVFGFLSDMLGCGILLITQLIYGESAFHNWWYKNITSSVAMNPFSNIFGFLYVALAIAIAGGFIYLFNKKFCYKNCDLTEKQVKIMSLWMAVATAPYVVLIPTQWIY